MADITECPVCFEDFQDPKLLPCTHTLCLKCLETLEKDECVVCPMCNAKHKVPDRGVKAFTDNQHAAQLTAYSQKLKELEKRLTTQLETEKLSEAVSEATIEEDPQVDQTTEPKPDHAKNENACELEDNSERGAESQIAAPEINGAESLGINDAATTHTHHESNDKNHEAESVRPKVKREYNANERAEILANCRHRLAAIEGEYDPKRCSSCGKTEKELEKCRCGEIDETLKSCTKCKIARYCSRKCQRMHWKEGHKNHCDEVCKLRTIIQHESYRNTYGSHEVKQLKSTLDREPYTVAGEMNLPCMCLHEDKQLIHYLQGDVVVTAVYNTYAGSEEAVICRKPKRDMCFFDGAEFIQSSGSLHIAVAFVEANPLRRTFKYSIEFWSYPDQADEPAYIFTTKDKSLGLIFSFENTLLISNERKKHIEEWHVTSFPIKPTGRVIPIGEPRTCKGCVRGICVMKRGHEKVLLVRYEHRNYRNQTWFSLKCLDYTGQVLWVKDNLPFRPGSMCTDHRGHVFVLDRSVENQLFVIHDDLRLQPFLSCPGLPISIAWCNITNRLYVIHETYGGAFVTATFTIGELDETEEEQGTVSDEAVMKKQDKCTEETRTLEESKKRISPTEQGSTLTFFRQKLALIQCCYDPKSCTCCGKCGPVGTLKVCIKCKTALYCSKECQVKDWKPRHKVHCKEIQRLEERIEEDEFRGENILLKANPAREPWLLVAHHLCPLLTCVSRDTQLILATNNLVQYDLEGKVLAKYDLRADRKSETERCVGICAFHIGDSPFVALSIIGKRARLEIWPLPLQPSSAPVFSYDASGSDFSSTCLFEGRLLAANVQEMKVEEFDISCTEIKPTGVNIPVIKTIDRMCAFRQNGEARLLYIFQGSSTPYGAGAQEDSYIMECVDFTGKLLWRLGDGKTFQPTTVRVDKEGRIFAIDWFNRVVTVNKDLSIQTVFQHEGAIMDISFCDVTNKLYVIHATDATDKAYCSVAFDIIAEDRP